MDSGSINHKHLIIVKIDGMADQLGFWWPRRLLVVLCVLGCHLPLSIRFVEIAQNWSAEALREFSEVHLAGE